jgi:hypothetical protein
VLADEDPFGRSAPDERRQRVVEPLGYPAGGRGQGECAVLLGKVGRGQRATGELGEP